MLLYRDSGMPGHWVVDDGAGRWWIVPAEADGWQLRTPYAVPPALRPARLTPVKSFFALGVNIPGA